MAAVAFMATSTASAEDPYLWLEDVTGTKALEWVKKHNHVTETALKADPNFVKFEPEIREILLSDDRLPTPDIRGNLVYNFWQDKTHVRGIYRKATIKSYQSAKPAWETVIDLDALAREENENWVWHGITDYDEATSVCLVSLSRGGADAEVIREFDLKSEQFVKDGFFLPEAKTNATWLDKDTLLVGTDFGEGSLTKSGYPRIVKLWKRGTDLAEASILVEGIPDDVSVGGSTYEHAGKTYSFIWRGIDFYNTEYHQVKADGSLAKIPVPTQSELKAVFNGNALFSLQKDWNSGETTYKSGSLVSLSLQNLDSPPRLIFEPTATEILEAVDVTKDTILLTTLNNVRGRLYSLSLENETFKRTELPLPQNGTVEVLTTDPNSNRFYVRFEDYLTPSTLYEGDIAGATPQLREIKKLAPKFSAQGLEAEQWLATSADGTTVPYFIIKPKDLPLDGNTPTILYGYGGFQHSLTPSYAAVAGKVWLERGNVYVVANIRGGGEFGPAWHQAALKGNRQRAFDDFQAVAGDLIARKVTSPKHLGIMGGSNGGLLMGVMFTQTPELFKAVVCQVPLLDMLRFHKLLAGHSWVGEYGNPDNEEEAMYIRKYSPYQQAMPGKDYPHIFFVTSSKDDRVHPGHARKMAAKLEEYGYDFDYFENIEGGHGAAANIEQRIYRTTLEYVYLSRQLAHTHDASE